MHVGGDIGLAVDVAEANFTPRMGTGEKLSVRGAVEQERVCLDHEHRVRRVSGEDEGSRQRVCLEDDVRDVAQERNENHDAERQGKEL